MADLFISAELHGTSATVTVKEGNRTAGKLQLSRAAWRDLHDRLDAYSPSDKKLLLEERETV